MSGLKCYGGDSGGPWFFDYAAHGFMKGNASSGTGVGQCSWAAFMSQQYLSDINPGVGIYVQ